MADAFIPASLETLEPFCDPAEVATKLASAAGGARFAIPYEAHEYDILNCIAEQILFENEPAAIGAAKAVFDALLTGGLAAYVLVAETGKPFRIPTPYWRLKSAAKSKWSAFGVLDAFPFAPGFDERMAGQPVLLSQREAEAFIAENLKEQRLAPAVSRAGAEGEALIWLHNQFEMPENEKKTKPSFQKEATATFTGLSGKAFDRAWAEAVRDHPERAHPGSRGGCSG